MRTSRLTRASFFALLSFGLTACASGGGGPAAEGEDPEEFEEAEAIENLMFEVINDFTPSSEITVYIDPYTGGRYELGDVDPSARRVFYYNIERPGEPHRLRAEGTGGLPLVTNQFTLIGATEVRWTVTQVDVEVVR